jgi:hypothetical protein
MSRRAASYGTIDFAYGAHLATIEPEVDGPIWMVNLMKYKTSATYRDGRSDLTGQEADDRYAPIDVLTSIGAEVVLFGDVDTQLLGDDTIWDRVGVVKYPSRRSFIDMQSRPDFVERHVHKEAGMEFTIVMGCLPRQMPAVPAQSDTQHDAQFEGAQTAGEAGSRSGPVIVMHVIRFNDPVQGPELMRSYEMAAAHAASVNGAGDPSQLVAGWFNVEGTIIGDGRAWHEVRFNQFPSREAFFTVVADPARQAAQREFRERAIADTYAVILRPQINRITGSLAC